MREREKLQQWKRINVDPRNASRAPNADHELPYRMRYESPIYACECRLRGIDSVASGWIRDLVRQAV